MTTTSSIEAEQERNRIADELEDAANNYYPVEMAGWTLFHVAYIRSGLPYDVFCEQEMEKDHAQADTPEAKAKFQKWQAARQQLVGGA